MDDDRRMVLRCCGAYGVSDAVATFCPTRKEVAMAAAMVVIWPLGIETESEMEKALNLGEKSMH